MQDSSQDHLQSLFAQSDVHTAYSDCFIQAYQSAIKDGAPVEIEIRLPFKHYMRALMQESFLPQKSLDEISEDMFKCMVVSLDKYNQWHRVDDWAVTQDTIFSKLTSHRQYRQTTGMVMDLPDHATGIFTCKSRFMDLMVKPNHHVYPPMIFSMSSECNMTASQFDAQVQQLQQDESLANASITTTKTTPSTRTHRQHIRVKERKSWYLEMPKSHHVKESDGSRSSITTNTTAYFRIDMTRVWSSDNETMAHWYRRSQKPEYEIEIECVDTHQVLSALEGRSDILLAYMILTLIRVIRPALLKNIQPNRLSSNVFADYQLMIETMANYQDEHDQHDQERDSSVNMMI